MLKGSSVCHCYLSFIVAFEIRNSLYVTLRFHHIPSVTLLTIYRILTDAKSNVKNNKLLFSNFLETSEKVLHSITFSLIFRLHDATFHKILAPPIL